MVRVVKRLLPCLALAPLLSGCAVLQQLDEWSRPGVRYVNPADIGPDGLPAGRNPWFVNKFILWSEVPVDEFYGLPSYSSPSQ